MILLAIVFVMYQYTAKDSELQKFFFPALLFKLILGIALGALYKYHYGFGDTWGYFNEASKLADLFWDDKSGYFALLWSNAGVQDLDIQYLSQPRAFFMVKLVSVFNIISTNNYWVSSLFLSLFSFFGCWSLALNLTRHFPQLKLGVIIGLLFYPSVVFWGAGIIKESIAMGALMLCVSFCISLIFDSNNNWKHLLFFVLFFVLLWKLKYYVAAVLALAMIPTFILFYLQDHLKTNGRGVWIWFAILGLITLLITQLHPNFHLSRFMSVIVDNHDLYLSHSQSGGAIANFNLSPSIGSILINTPLALVSAWFRPVVFETNNLLQFILSLENLFLLIWVIAGLYNINQVWNRKHLYVILSTLVFVLILSAFLALSTPNFGTLSRYRIMFVPFMVVLTGHDHNWLVLKLKVLARNLKIL